MKSKVLRTLLPLLFLFCAMTMKAEVFRQDFTGTIAGKSVRVTLYIDNNNYSVTGSYYYTKYKKSIRLSGRCNPIGPARNIFSLTEYSDNKYSGTWETNLNAETDRMTGTITNSRGKSYSINLRGR